MFGLYPPEQKFKITITIEQLAYSRKDGKDVWTAVSSLEIGPHQRIATSNDFDVIILHKLHINYLHCPLKKWYCLYFVGQS